MSQRMEGLTQPRVPYVGEVTAYVGNDSVSGRTFDIGMDGLSVVTNVCRASGEFVRLHCALGPRMWLDLDCVVLECQKLGGDWRWQLKFVSLDQSQTVALEQFVRTRRPKIQDAPHSTQPPRSMSTAPPSARSSHPGRSGVRVKSEDRELRALYREALEDLAKKTGR